MLLESFVIEALRQEIRLVTLESGRTGFTPVWAMLQSRFAPVKALSTRTEWYAIKMRNEGRITRSELHQFWTRFRVAWRNVRDATGEEARRLFLERVPRFFSDLCVEEEVRVNQKTPRCRMLALPNLTPEG